MIVVDTSALIAIAKNEPLADACLSALVNADQTLISAGTFAEAHIVAGRKNLTAALATLLTMTRLEVVALDEAGAMLAANAYALYGKENHKANLNYGDCFAYALAKQMNCPLLFVGNDFSQTDITQAI